MKTGIEKMVEWLEALPDGLYRRTEAVIIARSLAAEEKADKEPLAELADRKGKFVFNAEKKTDGKRCSYYYISNTIIDTKITRGELFDTEKQARQYLNGLENKK